uniref:HTH psq-type domain-containing protein n=1 Tax=Trichuris muris TaxID=70415 RepID=A0A5S6QY49_TRIMR
MSIFNCCKCIEGQMESRTAKRKTTADGSSKKMRKVITLEEKLDVLMRHAGGDRNSKISGDLSLHECTIRNIIKHEREIKEKSQFVSTSYDLQTPTRNICICIIEMERLV